MDSRTHWTIEADLPALGLISRARRDAWDTDRGGIGDEAVTSGAVSRDAYPGRPVGIGISIAPPKVELGEWTVQGT